jgi:hypothetical protein
MCDETSSVFVVYLIKKEYVLNFKVNAMTIHNIEEVLFMKSLPPPQIIEGQWMHQQKSTYNGVSHLAALPVRSWMNLYRSANSN